MHKSAPEEESIPDEELYIDAMHGFTVLHPLLWEKLRVPVSSLNYRQDSLIWDIPAGDESGNMLIRIYPALAFSAKLSELLTQYIEGKPEHSGGEIEPLPHAVGESMATTITYQGDTERLFAIQGMKNAYILSFSVGTEKFAEQLPLFETIAASFREL